MPAIELIQVPSYEALSPYNHIVDQQPINGLAERILIVNNQVDNNTSDLVSAAGSQGSVSNRLNQSLNADGSLKVEAVDNVLHSIEQHLDSDNFVRMKIEERTKLSFIAPYATSLEINVETISGSVAFANDELVIGESDSISWRYEDNKLYADTSFPSSVRHTHYYGLVPVTSDRLNYTTTSINTAYKQGSLRVYINGVRLNSHHNVYVPIGVPSTVTWTAFSFEEGTATSGVVTDGDFVLSSTVPVSASVVVDFDVLYS